MSIHLLTLHWYDIEGKFKILFSFGISLTHVWDFNFLPCISNRLAGFQIENPKRDSQMVAIFSLRPPPYQFGEKCWRLCRVLRISSVGRHWKIRKSKSICATLDEFIMSFRVQRTKTKLRQSESWRKSGRLKKNAFVHSVRRKRRAIPFENPSV